MRSELHLGPNLLSSILVNKNGDKRIIMAVWLEARKELRPALVTLTVDIKTGDYLKINLPDDSWKRFVYEETD